MGGACAVGDTDEVPLSGSWLPIEPIVADRVYPEHELPADDLEMDLKRTTDSISMQCWQLERGDKT